MSCSWVYFIAGLNRACGQTGSTKAGLDNRINQIRPHALGCFHPSRAIPTSVYVEKVLCMKKERMDG